MLILAIWETAWAFVRFVAVRWGLASLSDYWDRVYVIIAFAYLHTYTHISPCTFYRTCLLNSPCVIPLPMHEGCLQELSAYVHVCVTFSTPLVSTKFFPSRFSSTRVLFSLLSISLAVPGHSSQYQIFSDLYVCTTVIITWLRGLVQTIPGKINVIVTLRIYPLPPSL